MLRVEHGGDVMADQEPEEAARAAHAGGERSTRRHDADDALASSRDALLRRVSDNGDRAYEPAVAPDPGSLDDARQRAVIKGAARATEMADTIREKIVPQLLSLSNTIAPADVPHAISPQLVQAVAEAAVAGELGVVQSHLHAHTVNGGSMADALVSLIGGAAARLGVDWEEDTRDFMDVTIGLGTLQAAILAVSDTQSEETGGERSVLLGPAPGEDHTLGLAIVNHFFRQSGWSVSFMPYASQKEILAAVEDRWYAVVGVSVASESLVASAAKTVASIRRRSKNKDVKVIVGGPLVRIDPELAQRIGADNTVTDGRRAVVWAERWVEAGLGAGSPSGG
ncbi:MAG: cobalamin B12-binding domain-containing protein [Myxococcota bacterium]